MALPTVVINNSTGSNTAASGAGPSTALSGANAILALDTNVVLSVDTPNLSGVATDGSAVIWVNSTSGRKFGKITAVNDTTDTITCSTSWATDEGNRAWGIGGKRKDFETTNSDTKQLFTDDAAGWTVDIEEAGANYVLTSTINVLGDGDITTGRIVIKSSSTTRPTITSATNSVALFTLNAAPYTEFNHLKLTHTAATRGAALTGATAASVPVSIIDCVVDGCLNLWGTGSFTSPRILIFVEVKNTTSSTAAFATIGTELNCYGCDFHDNTGDGIRAAATTVYNLQDCIFDTNVIGVNQTGTNTTFTLTCHGCVFVDNSSDAVKIAATSASAPALTIEFHNTIFWGNGGADINNLDELASADAARRINRNNATGNNTNARVGLSAGTNDVTLSATDPFTNRSGRDFSPNSTAGGGALLRAAGFPGLLPNGTTTNAKDIGVQHADSGGGGGYVIGA